MRLNVEMKAKPQIQAVLSRNPESSVVNEQHSYFDGWQQL